MTLAQQDLVTTHLDLVKKIAGREAKRLPNFVDMDEIVSAGNEGLCEAADKFDPSKHACFAVWATMFIRGRIIDAFSGPRYPRRYVDIPPHWLGTPPVSDDPKYNNSQIHESLIDRRSPLDELIERQECVVVCIDAHRARRSVNGLEGDVLDAHIAGESLSAISIKLGISRGGAHKHLVSAKRKMRAALELYEEDLAA